MKSDIDIARECNIKHIGEIAKKIDIDEKYLEYYGKYKSKIDLKLLDELIEKKDAKLILVTAISPTPAGEGKTTTSIGLADSLSKIGKKTIVALREPSLGPVFGIKGGAAGGGYSQVVPMEDINLHFTGDFHAITSANNLLSALIDNHIHQGNKLRIDLNSILWKRCVDMNDRALRQIVCGLGTKANGVTRQDGFDISVASEVMAVLCLSNDLIDLKNKLSNIIFAYNTDGKALRVSDLNAQGAMSVLLKDALKPNLVQSLEGTPALIHGGPFANIAHGCNSIVATKLATKLADYVVTEAGFGADLGAEKFMNIKCRKANLKPDAVVLVASIRALIHHGGKDESLSDMKKLEIGISNIKRHIENLKDVFGVNVVVAINEFPQDTQEQFDFVSVECKKSGVEAIRSAVWAKGSEGGIELAKEVVRLCELNSNFKFTYSDDISVREKIETLAMKIYRAKSVDFSKAAVNQLKKIDELDLNSLPVCMAKTQYSFSDDPTKLGAPEGFKLTIRNIKISAGAGFVVALTGDVMTMPGLPKKPSSENIDIDKDGNIVGLF